MKETISKTQLDRGWAWVVLAAACFIHGLLLGLVKSFGLFFVQVMQELHVTASQGALLFGIFNALYFFMGPLTGALSDAFTCRVVVFAGGILCTTGFLLASVSKSVFSLTLSFGVVTGLGYGFIWVPGAIMISRYFKKRRALANGILYACAGAGGIISPPLVTALLAAYDLQQTFFLFAGGFLQILVGAALYRPPSHATLSSEPHARTKRLCRMDSEKVYQNEEKILEESKVTQNGHQQVTQNGESLGSNHLSTKNLELPHAAVSKPRWRLLQLCHRLCHLKAKQGHEVPLIDLNILTYKPVTLFTLGMVVSQAGTCITLITPAHGKEGSFPVGNTSNFSTILLGLGLSRKEVSVLLMFGGIAETVGRFFPAIYGDRSWCKGRLARIAACYSAVVFVSTALCSFVARTFATQAAYLILFHFCTGSFIALNVTILADLVGAQRMSTAYGVVVFMEGIGSTLLPVVVGVLRDRTETYVASYIFLSLCYLVTTVCFVSMPTAASVAGCDGSRTNDF